MKAFKGFNKDLTCRGFQYKVVETYEEEKAELCRAGFHACESPVACLQYYNPATSVYHKVELEEVSNGKDTDTKRVGKKITIGEEIGIPEICRITFEYVKEHCTNEINAEEGKTASAGNCGAASAGYCGAASAGDCGAASAGNCGAASAGDCGSATSRGKSATGKQGLSVARGNNVRVKGGLGAVLVIAEENKNDYSVKEFATAIVDGKDIKADTWYKLENGKLIEAYE